MNMLSQPSNAPINLNPNNGQSQMATNPTEINPTETNPTTTTNSTTTTNPTNPTNTTNTNPTTTAETLFFSDDEARRTFPRDKEGGINVSELAKVGLVVFDPSEETAFKEYYEILSNHPELSQYLDIQFQLDPETKSPEIPEGFVIGVNYFRRRSKNKDVKGLQLYRILIGAIPSIEAMISVQTGKDWLSDQIYTALASKFEQQIDAQKPIPSTIAAFVSSGRKTDLGLSAFKELSSDLLDGIDRKWPQLKLSRVSDLQQILSSKISAESAYPGVKQALWEHILNVGAKLAHARGLSPAWFENALETREQIEAANIEIDDFDDDLEGFLAK